MTRCSRSSVLLRSLRARPCVGGTLQAASAKGDFNVIKRAEPYNSDWIEDEGEEDRCLTQSLEPEGLSD